MICMTATTENIALIMNLLRIEDTSDETKAIISTYVGAAEKYLANTGIAADYENEQYINVVSQIVGIMFDNPEGGAGEGLHNSALVGQIEQLRLCQSVENTGG